MAHLVAMAGAISACSGDHDYLAQKNVDAGAPPGPTTADVRADEGRIVAPPADVGEASSDDRVGDGWEVSEPPEPPGRWTLTLINGLVDVESARFCLVPIVGDREMQSQAVLQPARGLSFGKSLVLGELPGIDLSTMAIHPYALIAADAMRADGGAGCAAILGAEDGAVGSGDGASGPFAVSLPVIPAGTLVEGRSYLGVVTGCARPWPYLDSEAGADTADGAEAGADAADGADAIDAADASPIDAATMDVFRPPSRAAICGASTGVPNAGLVVVRLSRRDVGARFGFQAVHASTAVAAAQVAIERLGTAAPILSADLGPYQIVPRDGLIAVTRTDFGPSIGSATLRIASPAGAFPALVISLASTLAASDIDETGLMEGDLLSLVLIGAQPGQNPGPPWNAARIAVVRNAPVPGGP